MQKTIGFIGCGNMAQAMIESLIKSEFVPVKNIIASTSKEKIIQEKYNIRTTESNIEVASQSDYLILAVKPNIYGTVLQEIKDHIKEDGVVISIGAGISTQFLAKNLNGGTKYIKTMPNTPVMVGEGMTSLCPGNRFSKEELKEIMDLFSSFGKTEIIDEGLMDAATALSGSSPAFIYMLIEAMADGAVLEGIPRQQAYTMAAQAVLGSAKMVLETGIHPGQLKDNVCSPGGITIAGVASLEENGFRSAVIEAIKACTDRSKEMAL